MEQKTSSLYRAAPIFASKPRLLNHVDRK